MSHRWPKSFPISRVLSKCYLIKELKVRIKDIADRAGVSAGTVDRVMHNRGEVSDKTRKRVIGFLKELHYEPDILARTLASRNPMRVAVLIPFHSPENWFWKKPLSGIYDACSELNHFKIEIREFLYDQSRKQDFVEKAGEVLHYLPNAVIAAPVYFQETIDFFSKCDKYGIQFISVNDNINHPGQLTYVGQDSRSSARVAATADRFCRTGRFQDTCGQHCHGQG